jgi:hypothetical protein
MSNWNRIGAKDRYKTTFVGNEDAWKARKKEITDRGHIILKEGTIAPTMYKPAKFWADVQMPSK